MDVESQETLNAVVDHARDMLVEVVIPALQKAGKALIDHFFDRLDGMSLRTK